MKKYLLKTICVGLIILVAGVGLSGCRNQDDYATWGQRYFRVFVGIENFKMEYSHTNVNNSLSSYVEIKIGNTVQIKDLKTGEIANHTDEDKLVGLEPISAWRTRDYRSAKSRLQYIETTTYLGRVVDKYLDPWHNDMEYFIDKEFDIVLKSYNHYDGGVYMYEVTYFSTDISSFEF